MAYKYTSPFLALLLVSNVLLATVATGRYIPLNSQRDMKEPEWFFDSGDHAYIPSIGRVELPPKFKFPYYYPYTGGSIGGGVGVGSGSTGHGYVPSGAGAGVGSGPTGRNNVPNGRGIGAGSGPTGRNNEQGGGGVGVGSGPTRHSYVPGGDDMFVPNPGYEVPYPGTGGGGDRGAPGAPVFP